MAICEVNAPDGHIGTRRWPDLLLYFAAVLSRAWSEQ